MIYTDLTDQQPLWWDLHSSLGSDDLGYWILVVEDRELDRILCIPTKTSAVEPFRYALAADYIEENWDRLLRIAETAAGVDPEPPLRRLLERLRTEWADCLNGVGK